MSREISLSAKFIFAKLSLGCCVAAVLVQAWWPVQASARDEKQRIALVDLSLEELAKLPVTSVSRRPAPLSTSAASIYVITGEDIRRSGATTLPEALRLAPNLQVARVDARNYAISARGFNNSIANKLLVLIDGRTVYSPLFSGVFWDAQDLVLEDVERIEVVSGPGSTLWGANAVNGVISITTRPASATKGTLVAAGGSMEERQFVSRYGGELGEAGHFRVYAKFDEQDDVKTAGGAFSRSAFSRSTMGMRADWELDEQQLTVQGDLLSGRLQQRHPEDIEVTGASLLARLKQRLRNQSEVMTQVYFDHQERHQPGSFTEHLNIVDLDLQHSLRIGRRHNLVWGGGYRHAHDNVHNVAPRFAFLPEHFPMNWASLFAQNDIDLFDAVHLTVGLKLERNPYTSWESLPNLRLSWTPRDSNFMIWSALSRSVRSPSRFDRDLTAYGRFQSTGETYFHRGGPEFVSEIAEVLEFGYRSQPLPQVSYSATVYASRYQRLRTWEPVAPGLTEFRNLASAEGFGVELWGGWQVTDHWRLGAGFVGQELDFDWAPQSQDRMGTTAYAISDPEVFWQVRSSYAASDNLELEAFLRRVGDLRAENGTTPGYSSLDLRAGWQLGPALELSVIGQNLLDASHSEYGTAPDHSEFRRALYVKLLWEF